MVTTSPNEVIYHHFTDVNCDSLSYEENIHFDMNKGTWFPELQANLGQVLIWNQNLDWLLWAHDEGWAERDKERDEEKDKEEDEWTVVCHESQLYVYLLLAVCHYYGMYSKVYYAHVMIVCVLVLSGCSVTTPSFCVRMRVLGYITLATHAYHHFPMV